MASTSAHDSNNTTAPQPPPPPPPPAEDSWTLTDPWASAAEPPTPSEPPPPLVSQSTELDAPAIESAVPFGDYAPLPLHFSEAPRIVSSQEIPIPNLDSIAPVVPEPPAPPQPPLESRGFTSRAPGRPSSRFTESAPTPTPRPGSAPPRRWTRRPSVEAPEDAGAASGSYGFKSRAFSESSLYEEGEDRRGASQADAAGGTTVEGDLADSKALFEGVAAKFSGEEFTREITEDEAGETRSVSIKNASQILKRPADLHALAESQRARAVRQERSAESQRRSAESQRRSAESQRSPRPATRRARAAETGRRASMRRRAIADSKTSEKPGALSAWLLGGAGALVLVVACVWLFDAAGSGARRPRVLPQRSYGASAPRAAVAAGAASAADLSPRAAAEARSRRRGGSLDFSSSRRLALRQPEAGSEEVLTAAAEAWNLLIIENKLYTAAARVAGCGQPGLEAYLDRVVRSRPKAEEAVLALELLSVLEEGAERLGLAVLLRRGRGSLAALVADRIAILRGPGLLEALIRDFVAAGRRLTTSQRRAALDLMGEYGVDGVLDQAKGPESREVLLSLVVAIDPERVLDDVGDWLAGGDRLKRRAALDLMRGSRSPILLDELHTVLKTETDRDLFMRACRVAAAYRRTASAPVLLSLLSRGNAAERQAVVRALQRISGLKNQSESWDAWWQSVEGSFAELDSLCAQARDASRPVAVRLHTLERLGAIGDAAVEDLAIGLLRDPSQSEDLRRAAVRILERWEVRAAVPELVACLDDSSRLVRSASERALRRLTGENYGRQSRQWLSYIQRHFGKRRS